MSPTSMSTTHFRCLQLAIGVVALAMAFPAQAAGAGANFGLTDAGMQAAPYLDYSGILADAGDCVEEAPEQGEAVAAVTATPSAPAVPFPAPVWAAALLPPAMAQATANQPRSYDAPVLLAALQRPKNGKAGITAAAGSVPPTPVAGAAASSAAAPGAASATWSIKALDRTLNAALQRWAYSAGWQLLWEAPIDYAVEADTNISGSFEQAVETVTQSMSTAEIPLKAIFYQGNRVLRIVAKGTE